MTCDDRMYSRSKNGARLVNTPSTLTRSRLQAPCHARMQYVKLGCEAPGCPSKLLRAEADGSSGWRLSASSRETLDPLIVGWLAPAEPGDDGGLDSAPSPEPADLAGAIQCTRVSSFQCTAIPLVSETRCPNTGSIICTNPDLLMRHNAVTLVVATRLWLGDRALTGGLGMILTTKT